MINNVEFPEGITFVQRYITGADLVSDDYNMIKELSGFYQGCRNYVIDIRFDMRFDTTESRTLNNVFQDSKAERVVGLNICKSTYLLFTCSGLVVAPYLDTSNVTDMQKTFYSSDYLLCIPQYNFQSVTNLSSFVDDCPNLYYLPDVNCVSIKNFGAASYSSWLRKTSNLRRIGIVDCDSVTDIRYALGNQDNPNLLHLGGFRNLGKATSVTGTDSTYFLNYVPNLTYESIINVLNGLYDRASAGMSVLTLKLHANHLSQLTEDDIAIATNKGWNLI